MNIVCLGEALIDFKAQAHLQYQGYVGGSPLNVAVAAARLGANVGFATQISSDMFGEAIEEYLRANRVDTALLLRDDAPSTLAFVGEVNGEAVFSFMGTGAADRNYNPQPRPQLDEATRYLFFGSISLLFEPTSTTICDIVAQHQGQAVVMFDPNVRPNLIAAKKDYLASLERWRALSDIIKISTQDLSWLFPDDAPEAVAERWLKAGSKIVIITKGSEGVALYRAGDAVLTLATPRVEVVDTVGAGDTFSGALLVALHETDKPLADLSDNDWRKALRAAVAAAALNCRRSGANPPNRDELEQFMAEWSESGS
jgi:fructokinase